jgi:ABC-2 type transport system ATP-binding protein
MRCDGPIRTVERMIELKAVTKRYGATAAIRDLSFEVRPGVVTGFLGPNGSGKSTTLRVLLGLDRPTAGATFINGRSYVDLPAPLREVGAMLDARAVHPGRSAHDHLLALARSNRIPTTRVREVLGIVGLADVAGRRAGAFSLGMSQRLGVAAALLGDPAVLVFDEPMNGLDTEGIRWIRGLLKGLAAAGCTVFLSSHLMSEMELTADELIVIGRGELIAATSVAAFIAAGSRRTVLVRTPDPSVLRSALARVDASVELDPTGALVVTGMDAASIGDAALHVGVPVHELREMRASLEDVYSRLTAPSVEYAGSPANDLDEVSR